MLSDPITTIPLIGPKQSKNLEKLDILTIKDLLFHIPYKYKDTSEIITIKELKNKAEGTIIAKVQNISNIWTRNHKVITKAKLEDNSGEVEAIWFNQSFLTKNIKAGDSFLFEGKISPKNNNFSSPSYEKFNQQDTQIHLGKITPFYNETYGVTSKWLRSRISWLKDKIETIIEDPLPKEIIKKYNLINLETAIKNIHFAEDFEVIEKARERLAFDEILNISLGIEERKVERGKILSPKVKRHSKEINDFIKSLEFTLTKDQNEVLNEILHNMEQQKPMNRLLNGDVGSGKTIIAAISAYNASLSGSSTIIMAPTTILAKQHYKTLKNIFKKTNIKIQLRITKQNLEDTEETQIIVGTHALLYNTKLPKKTGLVVVDEQHRFGVKQRHKIREIQDNNLKPHYLTMTATPIPRTLTSVLYGDMDISLILNKPKNRLPVNTYLITEKKRLECYKSITKKILESKNTEQAFIIFPLIDESEKIDAKAATKEYETLSKTIFKHLKTELLHGKIKEQEKNQILKNFRDRKLDILFATSVVEVGIDIPNATIMIIESAERFGLAQLHQFRGRIGRGEKQSHCFIIPHKTNSNIRQRLDYFCKHNSGFDVAEYDLKHRGPGEVYGLKQTGIPILKVGDITDFEGLNKSREVAQDIIKSGYNIKNIQKNLFK